MLSYETLLDEVTGNGRYQMLLVFLGMFSFFPAAFMNTGAVFLSGLPTSYCNVQLFNASADLKNDVIRNIFIPYNELTKGYDRCLRYDYNLSSCENNQTLACVYNVTTNVRNVPTIKCDTGFYYIRTFYDETVVTEWNLVCNKLVLKSISSSLFYVGLFVGALFGGILADRFGRITIYRTSCVLSLACGIAIAYSPNIYVFSFLRFLVAALCMPGLVAAFVYASEVSKPSWRVYIGAASNSLFGVGCAVMAVFAIYWRHWRSIEIVFAASFIPCFLLTFVMPESPRWLIARGREEEAIKVLLKMAKRNNAVVSKEMVAGAVAFKPVDEKTPHVEKISGIRELTRRPYSRFLLIGNCCIWAINSMVFYGLALNGGSLVGNLYVNHALGGIVEFAACILIVPFIWKFGRTKPTVATLGISSMSCILSTLVIQIGGDNPDCKTVALILAMVGRFSSSATFAINYQQTVELFPTPGRATALGISSTAARLGSVFSPFTIQLQYTAPWITPTIFGTVAFFAAILASSFPETKGNQLMTSFDEAEAFFKARMDGSWIMKLCCFEKNSHQNTAAYEVSQKHLIEERA